MTLSDEFAQMFRQEHREVRDALLDLMRAFRQRDQPQEENMTHKQGVITLDVRSIPPWHRHGKIFETFEELPPRGVIRLVNDHDPRHLHYQFRAEHPGEFDWEYLEQGPDTWKVEITRTGEGCC